MDKKQIRKLARDSIKAGLVGLKDSQGNGYLGYVIFVREGIKYSVITIDEDIANLNGNAIEFMCAEITYALDCMKKEPFSIPMQPQHVN